MPASAFLSALYKIHSDLEIKLGAQDAADTTSQRVSALAASAAANEVCHKALQLMPVFMSSAETPLSRDCFFFLFFFFPALVQNQHRRASPQTLVQGTARFKSNN